MPELEDLYAVLRQWAIAKKIGTYSELSRAYQKETGTWLAPRGTWGAPLGRLNGGLHEVGAPALSALVVLKASGEPGGLFWDCAPNVPPRPSDATERLGVWSAIVKQVHAYEWPERCPI